MIPKTKNIPEFYFGKSSFNIINKIIDQKRIDNNVIIYFIDNYFKNSGILEKLPHKTNDLCFFVLTDEEPTTDIVDLYLSEIKSMIKEKPCTIVGIGGGCTLDISKAISNLLTNGGKAEDYQGWDLVKVKGVYKIGIPTISGTGAEASRTCVMINKKKNLKLGMNSEFTLFDTIILDPELTVTVERNQYFYTGLDTYIHCIESLNGTHRHPVADSFSREALRLSREVFSGMDDMMNDQNREKLMVASYLGGSAIANSYVGIVHPLSAGLSVVLGIHHCLANCLIMNNMNEFYPEEYIEFQHFLKMNKIELPLGIATGFSEDIFNELYNSSIIHEKPLMNALGDKYKEVLTRKKVREIFERL